jgi:adenylate kinase
MVSEGLKIFVFVAAVFASAGTLPREQLSVEKSSVTMKKDVVEERASLARNEEAAVAMVDRVWDDLCTRFGEKNIAIPKQIVLLNGAPGAGKGTNTTTIMRILEIPTHPIEISSLLNTPECERLKSIGELISDDIVIERVMAELLKPENAGGVIIDGYPRTPVQAYFLKHLIIRLRGAHNKTIFRMINFHVSQKTSIERQLARGVNTIERNKRAKTNGMPQTPVRDTDLSPQAAARRYKIYEEVIDRCVLILQEYLDFHEINSEGTFEEVKTKIRNLFPEEGKP